MLLATTLSCAMHLGVAQLGGLDLVGGLRRQFFGQTTVGPRVEVDNTEQIRQAKLAALKNEKQIFLEGLFLSLSTGKPIKMSDFFIKRDTLERNLDSLQKGGGLVDEAQEHEKLNEVIALIDKANGGLTDRDQVVDRLHRTLFTSYFKAYALSSVDLIELLHTSYFKCDTATQLKTVLMERKVRPENFGVVLLDPPAGRTDGHVLSWYRSGGLWEIENTSGARPYRAPFTKGLRVPSTIFVVAYLLVNGYKLEQLPHNYAEYYKHGIGGGGLPIAGVSHDNPPPPEFMLNEHYFEGLSGIVGKAKLTITANDFFPNSVAPAADFEVPIQAMKFYPGIDWCAEADRETKVFSGTENQTYFNHNLFDGRKKMFRYRAAIMMADLGVKSGAYNGERCLPSAEFAAFRRQTELILSHNADTWNDTQRKAVADMKQARPLLLQVVNDVTVKSQTRMRAYNVLASIHDPADFSLFKAEYLADRNRSRSTDNAEELLFKFWMRASAVAYFGYQQGEEKKAAGDLLVSTLKSPEPELSMAPMSLNYQDIIFKMTIYNLIKIGRGTDAIPYYKSKPGMEEAFKLQLIDGLIDFSQEQAPPIGQATIESLINWSEEKRAAKVYWIALLAKSGALSQAESYLEKEKVLDYLLAPDDQQKNERETKGNVILTLGRINSSKIKPFLLKVLAHRPDFALEIADVFQQTGQLHEPLISVLRGIFNDPAVDKERKEYAAYVLLRYGRL